ncbi:monocarboxylate transporter 7-like [Euwallacea fornicatus]|uniref:monocarboxylate transporter 7-like n=1 Tax=Euwallacea fornicatus TaxID=995702 RepID=UPI00338DA3CF
MGAKAKSNEEELLAAPDGGWGYVIVGATVVIFGVTAIPVVAFGLIYGEFLRSLGDETTGTTISNGVFTTVYSFTGLLANGLLNIFSYRQVGFMGSIFHLIGAVGLIFSRNMFHLIVSFGIIQGIGFGLLMPASLSAFNSFFDRKMAVMMSICQALTIAFNMVAPQLAAWSMSSVGFTVTLIGLAAMSSLTFPACATLLPVKPYLKTVAIVKSTDVESGPEIKHQVEPLVRASQRSLHSVGYHHRPRKSVISLGDQMASVTTINQFHQEEDVDFWTSLVKSMDMSLLKNSKYLNVSIGLGLAYTSDMAFISILPLMLGNLGFQSQEIATMMGVFFASDLVSRCLLTIVTSLMKLRSRLLILVTCALIVIARTALVSNDTYMWKMVVLGILGFLRCFIQTPLPLVFSEEYQDQFATAYSLFMAVNGVVSLVYGPLMSYVKALTQSDVMVCHVLTLAYIICVVSWTCELTFCKKNGKDKEVK